MNIRKRIAGVFNTQCYLDRYPDVAQWVNAGHGTAQDHYNSWGQAEGRIPDCDPPGTVYLDEFDEDTYVNRYPDVKNNWVNAGKGTGLDHYLQYGQAEGRKGGQRILPGGSTNTGSGNNSIPGGDPGPAQTGVTGENNGTGVNQNPLPVQPTGKNNMLLYAGIGVAAYYLFMHNQNR